MLQNLKNINPKKKKGSISPNQKKKLKDIQEI